MKSIVFYYSSSPTNKEDYMQFLDTNGDVVGYVRAVIFECDEVDALDQGETRDDEITLNSILLED